MTKPNLEKLYQAAKDDEEFMREVGNKFLKWPNEQKDLTVMAHNLWTSHDEKKISQKREGAAGGFIFSCGDEEQRMFVKKFADYISLRANNNLCELFTAKFLEELDFGPRVEARCIEGALPFIISYDVQKKDEQFALGSQSDRLLSKLAEEQKKEAFCKILAAEILAKLLSIGDLAANEGNCGLITSKTSVRPYIIDFNYDEDEKSKLSRRGSNTKLDSFQKNLVSKSSARNTSILGLTHHLVGEEIDEKLYDAALEILKEEALYAAVEKAKNYCQQFVKQITDPEAKKLFDKKVLVSYIDKVVLNIRKLAGHEIAADEPKLVRKNSKKLVLNFVSDAEFEANGEIPSKKQRRASEGSGDYVDFGIQDVGPNTSTDPQNAESASEISDKKKGKTKPHCVVS